MCFTMNSVIQKARFAQVTFFLTPSRTRSRMAGTAAISVGFSTDASPLVPFLSLVPVSVRVNGLP